MNKTSFQFSSQSPASSALPTSSGVSADRSSPAAGDIQPFREPILVTRPFLPPLDEFCDGLEEIWANAWLTNNGPLHKRFQRELCHRFETDNLCLFSNGTLALQIALQGMCVSGEVITTPFTFVATSHALYWNKLRPVFVDIEPEHYTLDPERVEAAITPWTSAILAVHVYGQPCRLNELADIARRHNLMLIYDAAHAFGVRVHGDSIAHYGDLSIFSFHATKLFHTFEGGMAVFRDGGLRRTFEYLRNFGFESETEVVMPGTNAKMNEVQALMGLQTLAHVPEMIARRAEVAAVYHQQLAGVPGLRLPAPPAPGVAYNHAYFPVEIDADKFGMSRDQLYEHLKHYNVFARRYFYPLVCDYPCYRSVSVRDPLPTARRVAQQILALPIYDSLPPDHAERIGQMVKAAAGSPENNGQSVDGRLQTVS